MAINNPGLPNGGFTVSPPPAPRARVRNPGIPNGGFTNPTPVTPSTTSLVAPTRPISGTAPIGSQNYINYSNAMQQYGIQQLQQNAAAQGLPDPTKPFTGPYLTSNNPLAAQYGNSPLAKWLQVGNQAPGTWAAGMMYNGQPITQADADQLNRVSQEPNNPTWFNQNSMNISMQNLANSLPAYRTANGLGGTGQSTAPQQQIGQQNNGGVGLQAPGNPSANLPMSPNGQGSYGAGYTGYGNINLSGTPGVSASSSNPTGAGPQGQAPGTAGSFVAGPPTVTTTNTNTSAIPRSHISNPAVGMPSVGLNGLPNNSGGIPNKNIMPVAPAPRVSGNYNTALNTNLAQVRA